MKRKLILATALALAAPLAAAQAATVVKEKRNGHVVVKHERGHPNAVIVRPSMRPAERRPHQFWHRGAWTVRIHGPAFRYPHGWARRHWAVGAVLPALFLTNEYYYDEYAGLGLQSPPPGYRWVRYGDDLLLVNIRTGAVEDTVEDVFE
ncbi:MAG TPA: RcnB family protein [Rhizomicrobium sp.]|nr:RcnB family protein [Rhizomicrobium sp.]